MAETNRPTRTKQQNLATMSNQLGKLPPQAVDLEEAVLGALMLEKDAIQIVEDILRPDDFYKVAHQEIYRAVLELSAVAEAIDMLTVTQQLRKSAKIELVGGPSYIARLTSGINSAANIEHHARLIKEQSIKRQLIEISTEVQKEAFEDSTDIFDLLDKAEQRLFDIAESSLRKNATEMHGIVKKVLEELEAKKDIKDGLTGVPSGFTELDRITAGWQKSDLIIVAGRPGMGKTAFALSLVRNAALDFQLSLAFFSLEMSKEQIVTRMISAEVELGSDVLKKGLLRDFEWQQLYARVERLMNAKVFVDDTPALSILELRAKARRLKAQHGINMIIVDYLQLMTANNVGKGIGNREQEIAHISRSLKSLAKELEIPVIALAQISRAVETRGGDKKPQLSDLRESGSLEQDADMVIFLYRPEVYGITQDLAGNATTGTGQVLIAKHRNGQTGEVTLRFVGKYTRFENLEPETFTMGQLPQGNSDAFEQGSKTKTFESKINRLPTPDLSNPNDPDPIPF